MKRVANRGRKPTAPPPQVFERKQGRTLPRVANSKSNGDRHDRVLARQYELIDLSDEALAKKLTPDEWNALANYADGLQGGYSQGPAMLSTLSVIDLVTQNGGIKPRGRKLLAMRKANPKLRVTRDAHKRKGFTKADGTKVPPTKVAKSTFLTTDQGKPGRTSHGAKGGTHSKRHGYRPWITAEGELGQGFLTTMSSADRKRSLDNAVRQHGYRTVLGKISALQRSTVLQQKYGDALDEAHEYLVKKHGGPGSFGPQSNFGATLDERQVSRMNRLKR